MNTDQDTCMRYLISGRVQGVFFRSSTCTQAQRLELVGYARNLPDGRVEVLACGRNGALEHLKNWLHSGPDTAQVTNVECESVSTQSFSNFKIF